jgi:hypothetical protein
MLYYTQEKREGGIYKETGALVYLARERNQQAQRNAKKNNTPHAGAQ